MKHQIKFQLKSKQTNKQSSKITHVNHTIL